MLASEDKLQEGAGVLLLQPTQGLGYQTAGAFQRVGARLMGVLPSAREQVLLRFVPLQAIFWDAAAGAALPSQETTGEMNVHAVIFTPEPALGRNRPLTESELAQLLAQLRELRQRLPTAHYLFALPSASHETDLAKITQGLERFTLLLCPALFGFRDHNLLDAFLRLRKEKPGSLAVAPREVTGPYAFAGDAASLLFAAAGKRETWGKKVEIPACGQSLRQFHEVALRCFPSEETVWLERVAARLSHESLADHVELGQAAPHPGAYVRPEELFPTLNTSLERALTVCALQHARNPGMDLLFPPGRGPTT